MRALRGYSCLYDQKPNRASRLGARERFSVVGTEPKTSTATLCMWIDRARRRIEHVNERIERNEETLQRARDFLMQRPSEASRSGPSGIGRAGSRRMSRASVAMTRTRDAG